MLNSSKAVGGRRTGRRRGQPDTREAILNAARGLFAEQGRAGTSVRRVAAQAGVDPSLVLHFFGSKAGLFDAALHAPLLPLSPAELEPVLKGPRSKVGERMVRFWVQRLFRERAALLSTLVRSAVTDPESAERLRMAITRGQRTVLRKVGPHRPPVERAQMAASVLLGLFFARNILGFSPLATVSDEALIAAYAPLLQRLLVPPVRRKTR
jgi:AcrR family transcriptional regulator